MIFLTTAVAARKNNMVVRFPNRRDGAWGEDPSAMALQGGEDHYVVGDAAKAAAGAAALGTGSKIT